MFYVTEEEVWAALKVNLYPDGGSPPSMAPVDRDFISMLIQAAQNRIDYHIATSLEEMDDADGVPDELKLAICMDVSVHYFSRLNPVLPDAYWILIRPFRGGLTI